MAINTTEIDVLLNAKFNASNAVSGIGDIQKAMRNLTLPKGISADLEKSFSKLTPLLKDYQKQLDKGFSSQKDIKNFNLLKDKIDSVFGDIKNKVQEVNGQEIRLKVDTEAIDALQNKIVKAQADLESALQNVFKKNQSAASIETKFSSLEKAIPKNWTRVQEMLSGASTSFKAGNFAEFNRELQKTSDYIQNLKSAAQIDLAHKLGMSKVKTDLTDAQTHLNNFFNSLKTNIREANKVEELRAKLAAMGVELENLNTSSIEDGPKAFEAWIQSITGTTSALDKLHASTQETANGMVRMVDEVNELKQSTQYFFSLRNMINLLKQGVRDAVKSIKELDKAMTDTAVVTDFNVTDMWKDLPKYTQLANELGATTQGAYETMTLYYQQGLNQQQAFALGAETMKMARIAGLDYAETTDMMTAALRGFNMELDEVSAKRVNDVYSELAAITASDTEEIGSAMQRTASIAHSAGMSFEGTSAFLAQAIETTREAPENIGTAMKTIVARFQEMKKNPLEITEVDGEEVNYNKIDAALKTIGVDLKDTNGQFRELDQVFLDISSRWDTLTQTQQRYIATTAAGSRQQSRFIAMMDNYDRTVQLMEAARNSSGASDEQFNKTMDSLEAKINQLKNTWQDFTMGLANDKMVKGIVDILAKGLETVNKVITSLSKNPLSKALGLEGITKSVLSLVAAFTGIKAFGRLANAGVGALGGLVDPQSTWKEGWRQGLSGLQGNKDRQNITNPIVQAINGLIPHIDKDVASTGLYKYQKNGNYNNARTMFKDSLESNNGQYSLSGLENILNTNQLNKQQQANFFKASPGLKKNVSKQLANIYKEAGTDPKVAQGLISGFKDGSLALDEVLAHDSITEPLLDRYKKIGGPAGEAFKEQFVNQFKREGLEKGLNGDALGKYVNKQLKEKMVPTEQVQKLMDTMNQRGPMEEFQDGLGKVGAGLMSAGSTLQMFGSTLSATNPVLGEFVSGLGNALTTMGSLANTIPALMNPLTIAAAAVGTLIYVENKRLQGIKDSAEEVTKTFEKNNKETQENISTLKAYRSELATLSKGVDASGNNVSLSDAEYERYLQIVDDIAAINPEIVQGYNAQGHAIIDNNNALSDTLSKLEQIQKTTLNDYISEDSLQKLIDARNISADYTRHTISEVDAAGQSGGTAVGGFNYNGKKYKGTNISSVRHLKNPLAGSVLEVTKELEKTNWFNQDFLNKYNVNLEDLKNGEAVALRNFIKNRDAIYNEAKNKFAEQNLEVSEALTTSFEDLNTDKDALDAAVQPVLQNLQTYVSNSSTFESIAPEFREALMSGLEDIVIQPDLDSTQMHKQAQLLIKEFDNLSAEGSRYSTAMQQVEEAQNEFAASLDTSEYTKDTERALQTLDSLMNQYARKTDVYSQAIAEYLQNQIDRIKKFTTEGGISLSQALNGVTDTIAAAEGAYTSFQESTKTDLSTGKNSMKSIFDEITKETDGVALHMEKFGDGTMWKGAKALLGDKFVEENAENVEAIKKEIRSLEPELKDGEAGFRAFWQNFKQTKDENIEGLTWNEDGSYDIDRNINPDVYKQIADSMHRSEEYVVAMLNAGKQFATIDFHNVDDVRKALATDEATIKSGNKIFVKSDYYEDALDEANIYNPNERKSIKEQDTAAGVIEIKNPDQITKEDFKEMGINNLPTLIKAFGDTGLYNKGEIAEYAEALGNSGLIDYNPADFEAGYEKYLDSQDHPELQPIQSIDETVQQIASLIDKSNILNGYYSKADEDEAQSLYDSVIGGKGADTATQYFGEGKNEFGNRLLTPKEFTDTYAKLGQIATDAEEKANIYYQGAKEAEARGDEESAKKLKNIGDLYTDVYKSTSSNREKGKQTWADEYAREAYNNKISELQNSGLSDAAIHKEAAAAWDTAFNSALEIVQAAEDGELQGLQETDKTVQNLNDAHEKSAAKRSNSNIDWKFGNVSNENRPSGLTDETGKEVTVLGGSKSFNTGQGQEVEIAYTPVVTLDGTGTILEEDTVDAYINTLIQQLQSEGKEVNLNHLLQLDSTGEIEGFEGIKNVIADMGENASITAVQMHALEAGLDVSAINTQYEQLSKTISKVGEEADKSGQKTADGSKMKSSADVKTTTYEVFTAGAEGDINTLTEKLQYLKDNYPEVHSELITEFPQYGQLETYSKEIEKLDDKEVQQTVTASIASDGSLDGLSQGLSNLGEQNPNISVTVDEGTSEAQLKKLDKEAKKLDDTKVLTVKVEKTGVKSITVDGHTWTISTNSGATGINNKIASIPLPTFGSAAKGKAGQLGPRGAGGLTLTGELGYEVAWIPSENRSMILGAGGPQMVNLPPDAVVYNHEQSKKILKRKGVPAGSLDKGIYDDSTPLPGGSGGSSVGKKLVDNAKKAGDSVSKTADNTAKAINRVLVWWDNAGRRATEIQRVADKNQKTYEKYLKEMQATLKSTGTVGQGDNFIANTQRLITEQQTQYNKAISELSNLDLGTAAKTNKGRKNQYNAGAENIVQISYKKGKKTKTAYMNTADYIYQDANGAYQINQAALNSVKNADQRKALADALNKEINDRISKRNSAADAIEKAQEALEKFSEELYESFFAWETELTKIQNITQKIEALTSKIARKDVMEDLLNAQVKVGTDTPEALSAQLLQNFTNRLQDTQETITKRRQLIDETVLDLQNKATGKNIQDQIATVAKNLAVATNETERMGLQKALEKLQNDQKVFEAVQKYTKYTRNQDGTYSVDFNSATFEQDKLAGKLSSEMGKAIQEFVKELEEGSKSLDDLYKTQREDLTKLYTTLNDLNDQWADYEKQLVEINEEANKKELDEVKKLSDSLKKSMDELLDEVKRRLEERRKIDDNRKTEQDISQKQQRLAALRADTSGGHQVEIAQLEKEIAEAQQNYQRSLEDQLLDKLQQQADIAERQRERQIEIQESLLSGVNNIEEVQKWMAAPEQYKNDILEQYRRSKGYYDEGVGEAQKAKIDRDFASFFTDMLTNRDKRTSVMEAISDNEIETIKQKEADQLKLTNKETATKFDDARTQLESLDINKGNYAQAQSSLDSLRQQWGAMSSEARALTNFDSEQDIQQRINDAKSIYDQEEAARLEQERKNREAAEAGEKQKIQNNYDKAIKDFQRGRYKHMHDYGFSIGSPTGDAASFYKDVLLPLGKQLGYGPKEILTTLADKMGWDELLPIIEQIHRKKSWLFDMNRLILTFQSSSDFQRAFNKSAEQKARLWGFSNPDMEDVNPYSGRYDKKTNKRLTPFDIALQKALKNGFIPYKTGGLASHTGPAWLDGTPSKPELVLNAKDTQNFITLKDVLSRALSSTSQTNSSYGNAVYEININVDHINNDYDVDKIAKRVKENIVKDSSYRNVTQVRKFR